MFVWFSNRVLCTVNVDFFIVVSNVDVKSFYDVVDVLLDFGLLQEIKDGGNDRKLKAPLNLEEDVIYNEFKQKLEICL